MRVASVVGDDFFRDHITAAVSKFGTNIFCLNATEVERVIPGLVIVDLEHPEAHALLRKFGDLTVAFGPHVHSELLAIAREFGVRAFSRSAFVEQLEQLLPQYAERAGQDDI